MIFKTKLGLWGLTTVIVAPAIVVASVSCVQKPHQTIKNIIIPTKKVPKLAHQEVKIVSWNINNYGTKTDQLNPQSYYHQYVHALTHDEIILREHFDLVGLEEINKDSGITLNYDITNLNRKILLEKIPDVHYSYFLSGASKPNDFHGKNTPWEFTNTKIKIQEGQIEMYAFIYNDLKLKPIPFIDGKIGAFYDNSTLATTKHNLKKPFVRAPFGVKWQSLTTKKYDFTYFITHSDSVGSKHNAEGEDRAMGAVETYFDKIDGKNNDLIFAGDTNYKGLSNIGFKSLIALGSQPVVDGLRTSLTSVTGQKRLSITTIDQDIYSRSGFYDRMFSTINGQYILAHGQVRTHQKLVLDPTYQSIRNIFPEYKTATHIYKVPEFNWAKYVMSDHDAIYMTIKDLNEADDQ